MTTKFTLIPVRTSSGFPLLVSGVIYAPEPDVGIFSRDVEIQDVRTESSPNTKNSGEWMLRRLSDAEMELLEKEILDHG